jgi:hypothetical protein
MRIWKIKSINVGLFFGTCVGAILVRNFLLAFSPFVEGMLYSIGGRDYLFFYFSWYGIIGVTTVWSISFLLGRSSNVYTLLKAFIISFLIAAFANTIGLFGLLLIATYISSLDWHFLLDFFNIDIISYINKPILNVHDPNNQLAMGYVHGASMQPLARNIAAALAEHPNKQLTAAMLPDNVKQFLELHFFFNMWGNHVNLTSGYADTKTLKWWNVSNSKGLRDSLNNLR